MNLTKFHSVEFELTTENRLNIFLYFAITLSNSIYFILAFLFEFISVMSQSDDHVLEIIPDQLFLTAKNEDSILTSALQKTHLIFANEKNWVYTAFFADFGPLHLGITYSFCERLKEMIVKSKAVGKPILYCCGIHPHSRTNAAVLLCAYQIFVLELSVEEAYAPFMGMHPAFIPYRDAGFCINTYPVTVLDCARAMFRARKLNHYNYKHFNLSHFNKLAKLENGDVSWIIPGKFIAFSGPLQKRRQISPGVFTLSPDEYVPLFRKLGVTCVIRFNSKCYDRTVFTNNGIRHVDLFYADGGNPSDSILQSFLQICENEKGAIAVHCKAGLGRTGTNIAAYMIKHYGYTAKETIAWCRLCRPGSIVGPQQQYLESKQAQLEQEGDLYRQLLKPISSSPSSHNHKSLSGGSVSSNTTSQTQQIGPGFVSTYAISQEKEGRASTPPLFITPSKHGSSKQTSESLFRSSFSNGKQHADNEPSSPQKQQQTTTAKLPSSNYNNSAFKLNSDSGSTTGSVNSNSLMRPTTSDGSRGQNFRSNPLSHSMGVSVAPSQTNLPSSGVGSKHVNTWVSAGENGSTKANSHSSPAARQSPYNEYFSLGDSHSSTSGSTSSKNRNGLVFTIDGDGSQESQHQSNSSSPNRALSGHRGHRSTGQTLEVGHSTPSGRRSASTQRSIKTTRVAAVGSERRSYTPYLKVHRTSSKENDPRDIQSDKRQSKGFIDLSSNGNSNVGGYQLLGSGYNSKNNNVSDDWVGRPRTSSTGNMGGAEGSGGKAGSRHGSRMRS